MAKKKPVAQNLSGLDIEKAKTEKSDENKMTESETLEAKAGIVKLSISDEIRQKLDSFEKVQSENANYAQQVSDLQDRIVKYMDEIEQLKRQIASNEKFQSAAKAEDPRVFELTVENARLKAEIKTLKARLQPKSRPAPKIRFNTYRRNIDGYSSWN